MSNTAPEGTVPPAASGDPEAGSAGREGRRPRTQRWELDSRDG
jgi:hypothetical protein